MALLVLVYLIGILVPITAGVTAYRRNWRLPGGGPSTLGRAAASRFGAIPAAAGITVVGGAVVWLLSLVVGFVAKALQGSVDKPAYRFVQNHVHANKFMALNTKLTVMGNNGEIQLIALIAVVVLAFAWAKNWWVPLVLTVVMFYLERYMQRTLAHTVKRGHPPTTLGTFPSGGVARLIAIYGMFLVLVIVLSPALSRAWRIGLFSGLGVASFLEAYSRYYLSKHWITDAVGGMIFGYLLLVVTASAAAALTFSYGPPGRGKHRKLTEEERAITRGDSSPRAATDAAVM